MDGYGYVVTATAAEAAAAFDREGVRHAAALENGEGFVAYQGERPAAGQLLVPAEDQPGTWAFLKLRAPHGPTATEAFYLFDWGTFEHVRNSPAIEAVTFLASTNVLVQTDGTPLDGALWGSRATSWLDTRVLATV
jgi:hypothetical protein